MNSLSTKVMRVVATLTAVATILSLSGFAVLAPVASAAIPSDYGLTEGNTISAAGTSDPDVYIVNDLGYKRLFLNPVIFSMYGHLGGFANVKNVSATARDAFPTSGLFRVDGTEKVYGIEVTGEDTSILHWVNTSGAQAVIDDPNFFKKVFTINQTEFNWYTKGADYTSVNQVPNYSRTTPTPIPNGPVSVSLASDNPAGGTIVDGQARYELAKFTFSGNAAVTNVKFKRLGVSADASLTSVYLYDGTKRLTDSATVADGVINFNDAGGIFTVSGSKTITVSADVDGTSGETIGVQVTSVNGNSMVVSGNVHQIATATLATVAYGSSRTPSTNTALDPADDVVGWQNTLTIGQRYVWLKSLQMRVVGSVLPGDLGNFRLFVDGVAAGSAVALADANGYVVFDLSGSPVKLETGSRVVKVMLDVINGSSRNFFLSVRQASDIWAVDSQYNASVLATDATGFPNDAGTQTISSGSLTITKRTDSPSGDVVKDGSGVTLARFEFKAQGERMKVENLRISSTTTPNPYALRNGALFADGVQIGSTATIWEDNGDTASNSVAYTVFNLGSSLIVDPGTPRLIEIRSDIYDAGGTNNMAANATITANIAAGSSNIQRLTSLGYTANSATTGNALTVKTGSLSGGKYSGYANQSVVTPKTGVKLGHFTLTAASSENVNVNTIDVGFDEPTGLPASKTLDVYIKVLSDTGSTIYTSPVKSTVSGTASSSYSVNFSLPQNKTYQVEVWGNLDTIGMTGRVLQLDFSATGVAASSGTSSTSTVVLGQTITTADGSLTLANGSLPAARLINGGQTATGYQFTLTPAYDDYYLDEVYVDLATGTTASTTGAVAQLILKDGSSPISYATVNSGTSSASFTGLNLSMPQSAGTKTFTIDVQFANVGVGANDTAGNVTVRLDGYKKRTSSGTISTTTGLAVGTYTGNANVVVKGYPTFTNVALPTSTLSAGLQTLFKTTVTATGGQISWNDITFTVASTSAAGTFGPNAAGWLLYENGSDITSSDADGTASVSDVGTTTRVEYTFTTERAITAGSSVTLELKTTVGGTLAANETVSTNITNPKGSTVTSYNSTVQQATQPSFVWSDQSAVEHSTSTNDWFTDGLVKTLAQTQSLTR